MRRKVANVAAAVVAHLESDSVSPPRVVGDYPAKSAVKSRGARAAHVEPVVR